MSEDGQYDEGSPVVRLLREVRAMVMAPAGSVQGVPLTSPGPFFRMGEPFVIPVSPDSADDPFPISVPPGATTFQWINNNPFSVRLCGTKPGGIFVPVTVKTGWLWLPGTTGIRTSLGPAYISVMAVDGPYGASDDTQKAGTGFVELQYGTGY